MRRRRGRDHLTRLLFDGEARGEHRFEGWDLEVGPNTAPRYARMVGIHESLHAQLNDSTAYGSLLHALAWVVRNRPEDPRWGRRLRALVARCRQVHESYATYLSLLVVGEGQPATDLLAGNALYEGYLQVASDLTGSLRGAYLRYHAVAASLRACMQGNLPAVVLERGLSAGV